MELESGGGADNSKAYVKSEVARLLNFDNDWHQSITGSWDCV